VVEYVAPGISGHATGYAGQGIPHGSHAKIFFIFAVAKIFVVAEV